MRAILIDLPDGQMDGRTDRRTDGRTDTVAYRDARTHLKIGKKKKKQIEKKNKAKILSSPSF